MIATAEHKQESPAVAGSGRGDQRYAHIVEESVHPFQALCGKEFSGPREGPRPDEICPKCLAIFEGIEGGYLDES